MSISSCNTCILRPLISGFYSPFGVPGSLSTQLSETPCAERSKLSNSRGQSLKMFSCGSGYSFNCGNFLKHLIIIAKELTNGHQNFCWSVAAIHMFSFCFLGRVFKGVLGRGAARKSFKSGRELNRLTSSAFFDEFRCTEETVLMFISASWTGSKVDIGTCIHLYPPIMLPSYIGIHLSGLHRNGLLALSLVMHLPFEIIQLS